MQLVAESYRDRPLPGGEEYRREGSRLVSGPEIPSPRQDRRPPWILRTLLPFSIGFLGTTVVLYLSVGGLGEAPPEPETTVSPLPSPSPRAGEPTFYSDAKLDKVAREVARLAYYDDILIAKELLLSHKANTGCDFFPYRYVNVPGDLADPRVREALDAFAREQDLHLGTGRFRDFWVLLEQVCPSEA